MAHLRCWKIDGSACATTESPSGVLRQRRPTRRFESDVRHVRASRWCAAAANSSEAESLFSQQSMDLRETTGRHSDRRVTQAVGHPEIRSLEVHNLLDWEGHLETLREMKANRNLRYIGVTTSHGRRHDEAERIMRTEKL